MQMATQHIQQQQQQQQAPMAGGQSALGPLNVTTAGYNCSCNPMGGLSTKLC